jgi:signal peptidase I
VESGAIAAGFEPPRQPAPPPRRRLSRFLVRFFVVAVVLAAIWVFAYSIHPVEGRSMWPALAGKPTDWDDHPDFVRDWVVVDKLVPLFSMPERFRICVFRHKGELSVKRLVGLPGEKIDFRGGDLFIGAGGAELERVARSPALIEAQLVPVPAGPTAAPLLEGSGPSQADGDATIWKPRPGQTLTVLMRYGAGADSKCITDDHVVIDRRSPKGRVAPGRHAVPDVRVTVDSLSVGQGAITFIHEIGLGELRRVAVSATGIVISSRVDGVETVQSPHLGATADRGLRFETLDGLFRVSLREGGGWRELFSEKRDTEHHDGFSGVRFEVAGAPVRVGPLEVVRDVHYVWGADSAAIPQPIPPDRMFLVGDNPEFSRDSRNPDIGPVPVSALVGVVRAVVLPWSRKRVPL